MSPSEWYQTLDPKRRVDPGDFVFVLYGDPPECWPWGFGTVLDVEYPKAKILLAEFEGPRTEWCDIDEIHVWLKG